MDTRFFNSNGDPIIQLFLPSAILLANIDYSGLGDYALKAFLGGIIWLGFKFASDYIEKRSNRKSKKQEKAKEQDNG